MSKYLKKCDELTARLKMLKKHLNEQSLSSAERAALKEADLMAKSIKPTEKTSPVVKTPTLKKSKVIEAAEQIQAQNLANMLQSKNMLGLNYNARIPQAQFQPTDEQLFGHLIPSEAELRKAEQSSNPINDWLREATKPLNARFKTPEEEQAYWDSIKIVDNSRDG